MGLHGGTLIMVLQQQHSDIRLFYASQSTSKQVLARIIRQTHRAYKLNYYL